MAIPLVLREFSIDPVKLLAECELHPNLFDEPENTMSFATAGRLFDLCVARTGCEHFGLIVGQRASAESMGALGYLMLSSPTVRIALESLAGYLNVQDRGAVVNVRQEGAHALLSYSLTELGVRRSDQIYACAIAVGQKILRRLCGPQWRASTVVFPFRRPANTDPYRSFFGVLPRFNGPEAALIFSARQLETTLSGADPFLNTLMRQRVTTASHSAKGDLVEELRRSLRAQMSSSGGSLKAAASALGVAERTLNRQLAQQHQTTFREVRDQLWYELARKRLAQSQAPIGEIGSMLGYSDPAAFTRAFRRWAGITPSQWRRGHIDSRRR